MLGRQTVQVFLLLLGSLFGYALFGLISDLEASSPNPGTLVDNQASVYYLDPVTLVERERLTNLTRITIAGLPSLDLREDQNLAVAPGSLFQFSHRLENTGNTSEVFRVEARLSGGPTGVLQNLVLALDANQNQIVDAGETNLPFGQSIDIQLAPGEVRDFIIAGGVPAGTAGGTSWQFEIEAQIPAHGLQETNTDTLVVGSGELFLQKSASASEVQPGQEVIYTLTGTNASPFTAEPRSVMIDGSPASAVIVRDQIPSNLALVEVLQTNSGQVLYHLAGDPLHTYQSTPPAQLEDVDAVAFAFSELVSGQSFQVSFRVRLEPLATGEIINVAEVWSRRGLESVVTNSNPSRIFAPPQPVQIAYYENSFTHIIPTTGRDDDLFVQVEAGGCNLDPGVIDTVEVQITNERTEETRLFTGTETGPNSGVFRFQAADIELFPREPGDVLEARVLNPCAGDGVVRTEIVVEPFGVVFDSRTNQPVGGAEVTLIDQTTGLPAVLLDVLGDGLPGAERQVTNEAGQFQFPPVAPGTYYFRVIPPPEYDFPSVIPLGGQPVGRRVDRDASYGDPFMVGPGGAALPTGSLGFLFFDLPVDTTVADGLTLTKEVSREEADIGDSVLYFITLTNDSGAPFPRTHIDDFLPVGFRYESGTTLRNGQPADDPVGASGRNLRFPVGNLADGEEVTFVYRARLDFGADKGSGINTAQATSLGPPQLVSNRASAQVEVGEGAFDSRATVIGSVYVDLEGTGMRNEGDPGVPGVRLFLEDGTWVITDSEGRFSLYGQRPITRVLKVDPHTLPGGAILGTSGASRFAGDPGSRFVDFRRHELHKANFALIEPTEALLAEVEARQEAAREWGTEVSRALQRNFRADGTSPTVGDVKGRPAAGIMEGGGARSVPAPFASVLEGRSSLGLPVGDGTGIGLPADPVVAGDLEELMETVPDASLAFLYGEDGDILPGSRATIRVKGPLEGRLVLLVNGEEVSADRIGMALEKPSPAVQAIEYVAVPHRPGTNHWALVYFDQFGNERERIERTVRVPGPPARLHLYFDHTEAKADGQSGVPVEVVLTDEAGLPVSRSAPLVLESTIGRWQEKDLRPDERGIQVVLNHGRGVFTLRSPLEPGRGKIAAHIGSIRAEREIEFLPDLRPIVATGILEGRINFNRLSSNDILPLDPHDAFQESFRQGTDFGSDHRASGRAAFYLKGKIKGETLLTIAYDSDKKRDDVELFRDLDPDAFYPVYGDSSVRGFDAQSTGNLYVRLDHRRSFLLLGDFNTRSDHQVRQLGDYNRSLYGVQGKHETSDYEIGAWVSDDSTTQVVEEFPANGTSGPFRFSRRTGLLGSEQVEVVVRDRNQRSIVLETRTLRRNQDYEFEPFAGRLLLRRPLPSLDANMNPQFIRVTYEVDEGLGERFFTYGIYAQKKLREWLEVGGAAVRDDNPAERYELDSANVTVALREGTYVIAEGARSESIEEGEGLAGRVELLHHGEKTEGRIHYGSTESAFTNPAAPLDRGREEAGVEVTRRLADRTHWITKAIHSRDRETDGERQGVRSEISHLFENQVRWTFGGRLARETATSAGPDVITSVGGENEETLEPEGDIQIRSLRTRIDTPLPGRTDTTIFGEYEQDVRESRQRIVAAGGQWQANPRTRLYGRHEFISSLGGEFQLNRSQRNHQTLLGVETEYLQDAHFFNEYRVENAIDGRQAEAATGLRNSWDVGAHTRLNTTFERVTPFDGEQTRRSTAATAGIEYLAPEDWKATARLEGRWAGQGDTYLTTLGYARRLNQEWTLLSRSILNLELRDEGRDLTQGRILTGLAWRQHGDDRWNALFRYEYKYEDMGLGGSFDDFSTRRQVHQMAVSTNYQPDRDWIFSATWAGKYVTESFSGMPDGSYFGQLLAGRVLYDLTEKWDTGLNLGVTFSDSFSNRQYAVGPEIGYRIRENARVGVGYNLVGFRDRDFDDSSTAQGFFLSLRIKFDENLFRWANFSGEDES
ncbi:MAG: DUF11 domain-containing protein [Opitutales bacterium]|nr:DUF11 domain-containing protein [Opitutales bacterium]MCH8540286.1 DUF11 domain-containing protein [Opitutales bacterium]